MLDNELIANDQDDIYSNEYPFEGFEDRLAPLYMFGLLVVSIILAVGVYRLGNW